MPLEQLTVDGFAIIPNVVSEGDINELIAELETLRSEGQATYAGLRNVFARSPRVAALASASEIRKLVEPVLGEAAFATRALLFDKSPGANWWVGWHQDKFITVSAQRDVPGYRGFWRKEGALHVIPPLEILAQMLTMRIHLDECTADHGPLEVVPGSHQWGLVSEDAVADRLRQMQVVACPVPVGGVMLMRPLLLHASRKSLSPGRRRVLHLEFAACELEGGLEWRERW